MAIGHVVTRGYGTGTQIGTIACVVLRGYSSGANEIEAGGSVFIGFEPDIKTILDLDGTRVTLTTEGSACQINVFWEAISLDGGVQVGPFVMTAKEDLPAGLTTRGVPMAPTTVQYASSTYDVTYIEPDGHGVVRLVLQLQ